MLSRRNGNPREPGTISDFGYAAGLQIPNFQGGFSLVLAYIIFSSVIFLAITVSTLFRQREPVRAWWYPAAPILPDVPEQS